MHFLYTISVRLYALAVRIAALFGNAKAKLWVEGRKTQVKEIPLLRGAGGIKTTTSDPSDWIWFHAASLGEFEQGRPVIEALKRDCPQYKILLSFFSPSGYEIRKNYPLADEVLYLPIDTPSNAKAWLQRHHFVAAFFIKYEFWFNYMQALKEANIPLFYISLILKEDSFFFKPYGTWFRKQLGNVSHFFVQDETTAKLLKDSGFNNVTVCGDTRFDRVAAIAKQAKPFPEVERFINGRKCLIAGSTWPPDEKLLAGFLRNLPDDYCAILAPHDISEGHIAQIRAMFPEAVLYTEWQPENRSNILVLNTIGILSQLFRYACFVYIGGGFGVNIHNIQEPVSFGCPVVFGPKYTSFKEAVDLVAQQGAFSVHNAEELRSVFTRLMDDEAFFHQASETCTNYLKSQLGATESIMEGFKNALFL